MMPHKEWRSPLPSAAMGSFHVTHNEGYFGIIIARTLDGPEGDEKNVPLKISLSADMGDSLVFDTSAGPAFGRCFWLKEGVRVTVDSTPHSDEFEHYLKPLNRGPLLIGEVLDAPGVDIASLKQKSFCCAMCFRRIQTEKDALNHYRDKHGRRRFQRPQTQPVEGGTTGDGKDSSSTNVGNEDLPGVSSSSTTMGAAVDATKNGSTANDEKGDDEFEFPPLKVVFQDEHMAVVVKPQGIAVQGDSRSLVHCGALMEVLTPSPLPNAIRKPRPCHRLDAPTGGLLLVAKTHGAVSAICHSFQERRVHKRYRALVAGVLPPPPPHGASGGASSGGASGGGGGARRGVIDAPISGQASKTYFRVVGDPTPSTRFGFVTTLDLWPVTGRKHQLRRHLATVLGLPIIGDRRYGGKSHTVPPRHTSPPLQSLEVAAPAAASEDKDECTKGDDEEAEEGTAEAGGVRETVCPGGRKAVAKASEEEEEKLCLWALEVWFEHPSSMHGFDLPKGVFAGFGEQKHKQGGESSTSGAVVSALCGDGSGDGVDGHSTEDTQVSPSPPSSLSPSKRRRVGDVSDGDGASSAHASKNASSPSPSPSPTSPCTMTSLAPEKSNCGWSMVRDEESLAGHHDEEEEPLTLPLGWHRVVLPEPAEYEMLRSREAEGAA